MLKVGGILYCVKKICDFNVNKGYTIYATHRKIKFNKDVELFEITLYDDRGSKCIFGDIGSYESFTNWFITEEQYIRNIKLEELLKS